MAQRTVRISDHRSYWLVDLLEGGNVQSTASAVTSEQAQAIADRWVQDGKRPRGRPRVHASKAEANAAYRERHGIVQVNLELPRDVAEALDAYVSRQVDGAGLGKSAVIVKLLRSQLLRKR